jgi:pantothenate kinase
VEGAVAVPPQARVVLLEGLYLLHDGDGWAGVRPLLEGCFYLDTPPPLARERLLARHQAAWGIGREEAEARVANNDGLNAQLVRGCRERADAAVVAAAW